MKASPFPPSRAEVLDLVQRTGEHLSQSIRETAIESTNNSMTILLLLVEKGIVTMDEFHTARAKVSSQVDQQAAEMEERKP